MTIVHTHVFIHVASLNLSSGCEGDLRSMRIHVFADLC